MIEEELQRARGTEATAELIEVAADVGHRTGGVVGSSLDEDSDTEGAVALVVHLLIVGEVLRAGLLDGALHVLLRHVLLLGRLHQDAQTWVGLGLGAPSLDRNGDFLTELREDAGHIAPALHLTSFTIFKCSSHKYSLVIVDSS